MIEEELNRGAGDHISSLIAGSCYLYVDLSLNSC